ncbi:MAG: SIMPL domain-containing protein [Christensenellales bacterium]
MKRITALALGLALLMSLSIPALAQGKEITAAGTATVSLAADTATIQLGANTRAESVAEATAQNDAIMAAVIAALKEMGIEDKDLVTTQYNVMSEIPYQEYGTIRQADPIYTVTNMLYVTVRDLSKAAATIDAATKAGANQIYSLTFDSSKSSEAYDRALTRAVEDAQSKAKVLAEAAGLTLGALMSISATDTYGAFYGAQNRMEMMASDAKGVSIIAGDVSVTANVTLVYAIE